MSTTSPKTVLFLPAWYPNKSHLSVGSFVRTHAEAVNEKLKVCVLHVTGDEHAKSIFGLEKLVVNGVETYILYYKKIKAKHPAAQLLKAALYVIGQFYGYYLYRREQVRPNFFHVHVLTRAAILPFTLSLFSKVDYFITEHWSRYLPQDNSYRGILRKALTKAVVKNASGVSAVSENLKFHMNRKGLKHSNFEVISNVTRNVFIEMPTALPVEGHFVHVSNFAECKNVAGILMAFHLLQGEGYPFSLTIVGDGVDFDRIKRLAIELDIQHVEFTGFLYNSYALIAKMQSATALILFSDYENQPVVITESLSLGVPVIATTVGGIPEMIDESNGILVEPKNVEALSKAIQQLIVAPTKFDRNKIKADAAQKFKSEVVAQKFIELYRVGEVDI